MSSNLTASYYPELLRANEMDKNSLITMWNEIKDLHNILRGTSSYSDIPSQKIYRAYLVQDSEVDDPTATIVFNNTGITPTYVIDELSNPGRLLVLATGLFTTNSIYRASLKVPYVDNPFSASNVYVGRTNNDYGHIDAYNASSSAVCCNYNNLFFEIIT